MIELIDYKNFLSYIAKNLHFVIPSLGFRSFFVANVSNNKIKITSINGKVYTLSEQDFNSTFKKFLKLLPEEKFKYVSYNNLKSRCIVAIFRELYARNIISSNCSKLILDEYTPIAWNKFLDQIGKLEFSDFLKYILTLLETDKLKKLEKENNCVISVNEQNVKISFNSISFLLTENIFNRTKEILTQIIGGDFSALESLGVYLFNGWEIINQLKNQEYSEVIGQLGGYCLGNLCFPLKGALPGGLIGKFIGKEIDKYFNTNKKIKKFLNRLIGKVALLSDNIIRKNISGKISSKMKKKQHKQKE